MMNPLPQKKTKEDHLVELASRLYTSCGVKGVTIDELCQLAGVSKKTFYTYFTDKDILVCRVTAAAIQGIREELTRSIIIIKDLFEEVEFQKKLLKKIIGYKFILNEKVLAEHREAGRMFMDFKEHVLRRYFEERISYGISLGWYLDKITIRKLSDLHMVQISMALNFPAFDPDIADTAQTLFFNGISTVNFGPPGE